jgi:hypothetical protein
MGGGGIEAGSHRQGVIRERARMVANKMLGSAGEVTRVGSERQ